MKNKLKKELKDYKILIILLGLFPFGIYLLFFNNTTFRIDSEKWAHFGDFIGGFGAVIFGAANLYFVIKLSYKLSQIDDDRNHKNNELEEKRNDQNKIDSVKPLASMSTFLSLIDNYATLEIHNNGLGPLKIKRIEYTIENKTYSNIEDLIHNNISISNLNPKIRVNTIVKDSVIAINSKIDILYLELDENSNLTFEKSNLENALMNRIVSELNKIKTKMIYTDIHELKDYIFEDNS